MNRKDFDTLARPLKEQLEISHDPMRIAGVIQCIRGIAREIKRDNANFDEKKFLERCGL